MLARRDPVLRDLMRRARRVRPRRGAAHRSVRGASPRDHLAAAVDEGGARRSPGASRRCSTARRRRHAPLAVTDAAAARRGLSGQKLRYMRDLCARVAGRLAAAGRARRLTDDDVIDALTQVKGIGRWTAEMFLMFRLHRPDVLPVGDLGHRQGRAAGVSAAQGPVAGAAAAASAKSWRPYRSVACWYLWASLDNARCQE